MSGSTSELVGIKKHEVYYIEGGDVYFLASSGYQKGARVLTKAYLGGRIFVPGPPTLSRGGILQVPANVWWPDVPWQGARRIFP